MPIAQHFKWFLRFFSFGANRDTEPEIVGSSDKAEYIDASNFRPSPMEGHGGSADKILGEEIKYPNIDNACVSNTGVALSQSYECIGIAHFFLEDDKKDHIIEFWADSQVNLPSIIRIDGKIVLRSTLFPVSAAYPLQLDVNQSCIGGEIYITDFNVPPMFFNLKDLMVQGGMLPDENGNIICTQKYFGDFDVRGQILSLDLPLDHPIFVKLAATPPFTNNNVDKFVMGTGGLKVGQYQYALRYVSSAGDRTAFSVATPLIPLVKNLNSNSSQYPYVRTFGDKKATNTSYGIHFRFRAVNILDYSYIEIKRTRYNVGAALGTLGIQELLTIKIPLVPQQIQPIDVYDNGDKGSTFSEAVGQTSISGIEKAKAIRYYNQRLFLMNIKYASKDIANKVNFSSPGSEMFPVIQKLYKQGHDDPYNHTYFKALLRGEKYGWSIVFFDLKGQDTFAVPIPNFDNYLMPDRRQQVINGSNTDLNSQAGVVTAANTSNVVTKTHEVFDLENAVAKSDLCSFKNIVNGTVTLFGGKIQSKVEDSYYGQNSCPTIDPAWISGGRVYPTYLPYHPLSENDTNVTGHNYRVDLKVHDGNTWVDYNPKGFAPDYYALGMALAGIDVDALPEWVQSFSIVRTKPAGRVVCQGLGFYSLVAADFNLIGNSAVVSKEPNQLFFFSPDIQQGIVSASVISDIQNNPSDYEVELVSPLGFFSEMYSFDQELLFLGRDRKVDLAAYVRILREKSGANAMNAGDFSLGTGVGNTGYVGFDKWRNPTTKANPLLSTYQFSPGGFSLVSEHPSNLGGSVRSQYYRIITTTPIYNNQYTGGTSNRDFSDTGLRNWHEPMYIVNIIKKNADVSTQNIDEFLETGHYQKRNAIIGRRDANTNPDRETFLLIDERPEDCISTTSAEDKVLFVDGGTTDGYWLNITNKTAPQRTTILNAILAGQTNPALFPTVIFNGNTVSIKGVYTHTINTISSTQAEYTIVFDKATDPTYNKDFFLPAGGAFIKVKYDKSKPMKIFGGDVTIGESIFAPIDRTSNNGNAVGNEFPCGAGFPYFQYDINPRVYIPKNTTLGSAGDAVQDVNTGNIGYVRQIVALFTVESRINMPLGFNDEQGGTVLAQNRYFPLVHYIMRPHKWDAGNLPGEADPAYFTAGNYPGEDAIWFHGGFRFKPQSNIDYSHQAITQTHFSKPKVGFKEETHFCTRVIWSEIRPINVIDSPGVRTFPVLNFFDISDDSGCIKFAWDDLTDRRGSNLYAVTDSGICMLMTDKRTITELSGGALAVIGTTGANIIQEQIWITKSIGMNDEMWRSAAEWDNVLYFTNLNSSYKVSGMQIEDILRGGFYHSRLYVDFLKTLSSGYTDKVSAVYDTLHHEYWIHLGKKRSSFVFGERLVLENISPRQQIEVFSSVAGQGILILPQTFDIGENFDIGVQPNSAPLLVRSFTGYEVTSMQPLDWKNFTRITVNNWTPTPYPTAPQGNRYTFPYGERNKHWFGSYDYLFDKFVSFKNRTYGVRKMETYEVNKGFIINSGNIAGWILQVASPEQISGKEFIRIRIASDNKPIKVEFFDNMTQVLANQPQSILDTTSNAFALRDRDGFEQYIPRKTASPNNRMQGRMLLFKITHNTAQHFKIVNVGVQYKKLR